MISIIVRDINGKLIKFKYDNQLDFIQEMLYNDDLQTIEDTMEIMIVKYCDNIIYNSLIHESITFEDLIGFLS